MVDIIKACRLQRFETSESSPATPPHCFVHSNLTITTGIMSRPSSSRLPATSSHPYHLLTPPSMAWGSHVTLVARGRRFQTRFGDRTQLTPSPEIPTEPESSPPRPSRRHLHRTRVLPARFRDVEASAVPERRLENQALSPGKFWQPTEQSIYISIYSYPVQILSSMSSRRWRQLLALEQVPFV